MGGKIMEYVYAALLLHKLGKPIDETHLVKVVGSTGIKVDEAKAKLLANSLKGVNIDEELKNATMVAAAPAHKEAAKEEKKEEKKEEASAAAEGLSSLFG